MREESGTKEIMVVDRGLLLEGRAFHGFSPAEAFDYEEIILNNYRYIPRREAEENPALKQPIAYCMIVNPAEKLLFAYKRAESGEAYDEVRLMGKWSLGIGGHIDRVDLEGENPIRASMLRELREEISWEGPMEPSVLGYINDEVDMVGKVHFGLLYYLETDAGCIEPRTKEIAEAKMISVDEWKKMLADETIAIEGWSRIASRELVRNILP